MSQVDYVTVFLFAAKSLDDLGQHDQADVLREATAKLRVHCEKLEAALNNSKVDAQTLAQLIYNSKRSVLIDNSPCWCTVRSGPHTKHCEFLRDALHAHNLIDDSARTELLDTK
jgi:hypothetical protein